MKYKQQRSSAVTWASNYPMSEFLRALKECCKREGGWARSEDIVQELDLTAKARGTSVGVRLSHARRIGFVRSKACVVRVAPNDQRICGIDWQLTAKGEKAIGD